MGGLTLIPTHNEFGDLFSFDWGVTWSVSRRRSVGAGPGDPGARALRLGPRPFSISVIDSLGGGFVWVAQLRKQTLLSQSTYGCCAGLSGPWLVTTGSSLAAQIGHRLLRRPLRNSPSD